MSEMKKLEVSNEMRELAEKSVEQAREAFDKFISAARNNASTVGNAAEATRGKAKDITSQGFEYAEQNVNAAFEFVKQLVRAKDIQEATKLQADFVRNQFGAMQAQAKDIAGATQSAIKDLSGKSF